MHAGLRLSKSTVCRTFVRVPMPPSIHLILPPRLLASRHHPALVSWRLIRGVTVVSRRHVLLRRLAGTRATSRGSSTLARPATTPQDLLAIADGPLVRRIVSVEEIVLAERADPFVRWVRERRHRHNGTFVLLPPAGRKVCRQEAKWERTEQVLVLCVDGGIHLPRVGEAGGNVVTQMMRVRRIC